MSELSPVDLQIIKRYKNLQNREYRASTTIDSSYQELTANGENPTCGDTLDVSFLVAQSECGTERIVDGKFHGYGCSLCMACADMLVDELRGKTLQEALNYTAYDLCEAWGGLRVSPARRRCMDLSLRAAHKAILDR